MGGGPRSDEIRREIDERLREVKRRAALERGRGRTRGRRGDLLRDLLAAILGVSAGLFLFDRVLMPRVVRHGDDVRIPAVAGSDLARAETVLRSAGLQPVRIPGRYNAQIQRGSVLEIHPPAGRLVKAGRQVFLTPSLGPVNHRVPDLTGMSVRMAKVKLVERGLRAAATEYAATDRFEPDQVLAMTPDPGSPVPESGEVTLLVSRLPAPTPYWMPDFRGLGGSESANALKASGIDAALTLGRAVPSGAWISGAPGTVVQQDHDPGSPVWPGTRVELGIAPGGVLRGLPPSRRNG
jgi:beta-lactam-binding protein with PASTA domain